MSLPKLKHKIIKKIDIHKLLDDFTITELALFFQVHPDFVYKTRQEQRIIEEEKFKNNEFNNADELKLGRVGAWKFSAARRFMEMNHLLESQNEII